jgi:hypothetical protein
VALALPVTGKLLPQRCQWSDRPDSQWLSAVNAAGRITAIDRSGHARTLDTRLPAIELATR